MVRTLMLAIALMLAFTLHAAAQKRSGEEVLARLHGLCERDYKPSCIKLGLVIGRIPPREANKFRTAHPEWFWWERW
jgi:hypothetical protein